MTSLVEKGDIKHRNIYAHTTRREKGIKRLFRETLAYFIRFIIKSDTAKPFDLIATCEIEGVRKKKET